MHPVAFRKALIEAYIAGAESMYCGCYEMQTKAQAREWFYNEYGINVTNSDEICDCCEEDE